MILVDSNYIISLFIDSEKNHKRAKKLFERLSDNKLVITNTILIETMNLVIDRLNHNIKALTEIYNIIKRDFKIIYEDKNLIEKSMKTVIKYNGTIGLADAISIEVMKELNIYEIFSFDKHFDNKEKIVRIH
ncbi:type II toxin-antitoxin system VapC family toxin [Methanobrevibacter curvatus]|uniref:tRNA(FMet)-specific endonuclease VapC n=1 Tax=Methanobrevibacter curvatus TaxID=49547 RepID=A0A166B345_9EURY|nr:PIN domain-containing protein [Methanobrevibacter curvatus]KZX12809.1 tRNA(fMet)-specific endonuclease VapC [Methanobrevibacter curvatus]